MTETRKCEYCNELKQKSDFLKWNRRCRKCRWKCETDNLSTSPEKFIRKLFTKTKNRNKNKKNPDLFTMSYEDWLKIYHDQDGLCAFTGVKMTHVFFENENGTNINNESNISADQIEPGKGYVPGNVHFICVAVNMMKQQFSVETFTLWCHKVSSHTITPSTLTQYDHNDNS